MTDRDNPLGDGASGRPSAHQVLNFANPVELRKLLRLRKSLRASVDNQDLDDDRPGMVAFDERAYAILTRAKELVAEDPDGRDDEDGRRDATAVQELARMAGRHRRSLQLAALGARQGGRHHEDAGANRVHRLLQAALTGTPVAPPASDDVARFAVLGPFARRSPRQRWAELVRREPRLADFDEDAQSGRYRPPPGVFDRTLPREQFAALAAEQQERLKELRDRLDLLVGPQSGQTDVLLSSQAALEAAHDYLIGSGTAA
ncbi:MAG: hypothetical protein ACRDZ8_19300 [Acidimicrobiales bacterium]